MITKNAQHLSLRRKKTKKATKDIKAYFKAMKWLHVTSWFSNILKGSCKVITVTCDVLQTLIIAELILSPAYDSYIEFEAWKWDELTLYSSVVLQPGLMWGRDPQLPKGVGLNPGARFFCRHHRN